MWTTTGGRREAWSKAPDPTPSAHCLDGALSGAQARGRDDQSTGCRVPVATLSKERCVNKTYLFA
eukprot:13094782-Alexandrium_andersonii.AAC.1